jgi:hypothetical protein
MTGHQVCHLFLFLTKNVAVGFQPTSSLKTWSWASSLRIIYNYYKMRRLEAHDHVKHLFNNIVCLQLQS